MTIVARKVIEGDYLLLNFTVESCYYREETLRSITRHTVTTRQLDTTQSMHSRYFAGQIGWRIEDNLFNLSQSNVT